MLHFTNQELAKTYHVSVRTIRNWIESAREGKLGLTLHTVGERTFIANTSKNTTLMKKLSEDGKKFRPHRAVKIINPQNDFYTIYTESQIHDIVSNLETYHEVPRQYNYFDDGAKRWDEYAQHLSEEDTPNMLNSALKLLNTNEKYIDSLLSDYTKVNVVDVCVGNALPSRGLLTHLIEQGKLARYIAIDISTEMLSIAEKNVKKWFGDSIQFEGHQLDITYDRFADILSNEYVKKGSDKTVNLALFLGGTHCNLRTPDSAFRVIHDSLGVRDILIHQQKLDSAATRRYFDFNLRPEKPILAPMHGFIFDLLNIDKSLYELELGYDNARKQRFQKVKFNFALSIDFEFSAGHRVVNFNKGDSILLWHYLQQSSSDVSIQLDRNDFYALHMSQTIDKEFLLAISQLKRD